MEVIVYFKGFLVVCFLMYTVNCSRNLAVNKTATQSSTYGGYTAGKAVDGIFARDIDTGHCSHTGDGHRKAWWKVDLGQVYRIQMINITYRHDYTYRLGGYSLYVTNDTDMTQTDGSIIDNKGHLCYYDKGPGYPTFNQTRQCHVKGRYVVFYNIRQNTDTYIQLCEVQLLIPESDGSENQCTVKMLNITVTPFKISVAMVTKRCPVGKFGYDCSGTCHCMTGGCDPDTGQCDVKECQTGWMGLSCSLRCHCDRDVACDIDTGACPGERCQSGWSGKSCFVNQLRLDLTVPKTCHCATLDCNKTTGVCASTGCSAGWKGTACDQACTNHTFGRDCTQTCHCANSDCDGSSGICNVPGCMEGWRGEKCNQVCTSHTFGRDCTRTCHCANSDCDKGSGLCYIDGCTAGWIGSKCSQGCQTGFFGPGCSEYCHCSVPGCIHINGTCAIVGCAAGWSGKACNQVCTNHTFGRDCSHTCHCANDDCDGRTGSCQNVGCEAGWMGRNCSQACNNITFGRDCTQTCHCANSDCDRRTGVCKLPGCTEGWKGQTCSQACNNHTFGRDCNQTCHCKSECDGNSGKCKRTRMYRRMARKRMYSGLGFGKNTIRRLRCPHYIITLYFHTACTNNTYGPDCNRTCHCAKSDCDRGTGICKIHGCTAGWRGQTCSEECVGKTFGRDCTQTCHCDTSDCDRKTGICKVPGCEVGWEGQSCSQECPAGYFGPNCTKECHCLSPGCNHINGTCHNVGCKAGWSGQACDQACTNHTFGRDCNQTCNCANSDCNGRTGVCKVPGCEVEWKGQTCTQARIETQTSDESSNGNSAQIGGIVGAVVAVLLVIVISFIVVRKRRARGQGSASSKYAAPNKSSNGTENVYINVGNVESTKDDIPPEVKITETDVDEDEVIYVNGPNDTDVRGETKLLMSELKEIVTAKKENEMYEVEFKSLPHGLKYPYKASNLPKNIPLNRFKTTFPYDHSRVVLKKEKAGSTDYINANFIDGVRNEKAYIATQGPKTNTLEDFWRMIWQNKCGKIVMLANLMELGKIKCITYWAAKESDEEPLELSQFQVKLQEETAYAFYTIRTISLKNKQTNSTRRITQYHFTKWPDHGVPEPFELLQFYKRIKNGRTEHKGPLVVHCSAGIGRTGSYIGLDALLLDGKNSQDIDVFAYVEKMRKGRMNMIQTAKQYEMLHFVLLEGLKVVTTSMSKTDFCRTITDMMEDDVPAHQFAVLDAERPEYKPIEYEAALKNKSKNRNPSILAVDNYKVRLMSTQSGYINAVNIPGYRTAFGYILTQHPLDNTTTDFLSLVTQERADTVVSIGPLQRTVIPAKLANKQRISSKIWQFCVVSTVKCDNRSVGSEHVEERQITIENKELGINTKLTLLETPSWCQSLPDSRFMLDMIQLIQRRRGIDSPSVIITCNDGATECGLLCAMCNVMERLEIDGDIDIMAAVRQLQIRRTTMSPYVILLVFPPCKIFSPFLITTYVHLQSQYVFCYQLVKEYLEADTVYANV
ncbi:uncharacterized protein [Argopecten irradians]|uniref:uncharacterized protein n=1 Tax=Argopecten irradians TaxID=31199 RepID=UPI0037245740